MKNKITMVFEDIDGEGKLDVAVTSETPWNPQQPRSAAEDLCSNMLAFMEYKAKNMKVVELDGQKIKESPEGSLV